ncbi:Homeodomain-like protein [Umbelopsis sp. PMI_123]|nr:Homeodomain-like protein [Umbelopsis sp. PMI_123]
MDTTSDYSSTQSAIDDTCASIADGSPITPRIPNKRSTSSSPSKRNKKSSTYSRWTSEEDSLLRQAVMLYGPHKWSMIASHVPNRTPMQCSTRWLGALNPNIYKGRWTQHEDAVLRYAVQEYSNIPDGEDGAQPIPWNKIAQRIPNRTGIQCQARWTEALDPTVRKGKWSEPEDALLRAGVQTYGKCWIRIAESIPGRTQRQCRTRWVQLKYKEEKQSTRTNSKASGKSSADASRGIQHSRQRSSVHSHIDDSVAPSLPQSSSSSTVSWEGESRTPFEDGSSDIVQVSNNNFFATDLKQYHQMVQPFSDVKFEVSRIYIPGFGLTTTDDWPR